LELLRNWIVNFATTRKGLVVLVEDLHALLNQREGYYKNVFREILVYSKDYPVRVIAHSSKLIPPEWEAFFSVILETEKSGFYEVNDAIFLDSCFKRGCKNEIRI